MQLQFKHYIELIFKGIISRYRFIYTDCVVCTIVQYTRTEERIKRCRLDRRKIQKNTENIEMHFAGLTFSVTIVRSVSFDVHLFQMRFQQFAIRLGQN